MKPARAPRSHPDGDQLARFVRSLRREGGNLLLHLLACKPCCERTRALLAGGETRWEEPGNPERLWPRLAEVAQHVAAVREAGRREADVLLAEILATPLEERPALVAREPRFHHGPLAERVLDLAQAAEPGQESWARLALVLVPFLDSFSPAAGVRQDFHAAAHGTLAEALYRRGDLAGAEAELTLAAGLLAATGDATERAAFCRRRAALLYGQNRLDEAAALLERAADLAEDLGDAGLQAEVLVDLGDLYLFELADPSRALATFDTVLLLAPAGLTPALTLRAIRGAVQSLLEEDRVDEALDTLRFARERQGWAAGSTEGLALRTLEGRVLLALDRAQEAKKLLDSTFRKLVAQGAFEEAAAAGVTWIRSQLEAGEPGERSLRLLAALGEIAILLPAFPSPAGEPLERLLRAAKVGELSSAWLLACEEQLASPSSRGREGAG